MSLICDFLRRQLDAGPWRLGQIVVRGDFSLRHADEDAGREVETFTRPTDARELAKYDDAGRYRPLKTAPNLRHGWRLELGSVEDVRLALDFFYPAALGTRLVFDAGTLAVIPLRATLGRQSGMYRVTQLITDGQAGELIQKTCVEGCLRRRLWTIDAPAPDPGVEAGDVLCAEACNLLVAACRPVAKQNVPRPPEGDGPVEP